MAVYYLPSDTKLNENVERNESAVDLIKLLH
jgi:hypothetical protein